jgi:HSP20 family protein
MVEKTVPSTREETPARELTRNQEQYIAPPVDIYEDKEGLTVLADMPGVNTESLDVRVEQGILTLEARVQAPRNGEPYYREFQLVNFFRQFQLSEQVDVDKITAELKDGVLTVKLPTAEKAKPKRIQVKGQ